MNELPPENQYKNKREKIDLEKLNFEELKKVSQKAAELARKSFKETGNGFQNVNGNGISIMEKKANMR